MTDTAELRRLLAGATPGPWKSRTGYGPDKFAPDGYRYVQFGPTEAKAGGLGTDQLSPEDADFIAAARNQLPSLLDELEQLRRVRDAAKRLASTNLHNDYGPTGEYTTCRCPEHGAFYAALYVESVTLTADPRAEGGQG